MYGEALFVGGRGDELHDDLVAHQRFATPVLTDERKESMLDLVPFARAGRQMANVNVQASLVCKPLQLALPEAIARAVAAPPPSAVIMSRCAPG